jgi:hypothetical protein
MNVEAVEKLKERYPNLHPLIFQRSVERTNNFSELFDILESFPHKYPIVWNSENRRWMTTKDLSQVSKFDFEEEVDDV